jgi:hypothetical protein
MPWGKIMTAGERTMVAVRIGDGTFCKKICKTAKGGSLAMTALALGSAPPSRLHETKNGCPLFRPDATRWNQMGD